MPASDRYLLCFSLPLVAAVTVQALLSRAHANWAAPAYVAASILVPAVMLRQSALAWLRGSVALHGAIAIAIAVATAAAPAIAIPGAGNPFARTLGHRETADAVRAELAAGAARGTPYAAVIGADRDIVAALLYYGRDLDVPVFAWRDGDRPRNHFELTRAYAKGSPQPALVLARAARVVERVARGFAVTTPLPARDVAAGNHDKRTLYLQSVSGFKGR